MKPGTIVKCIDNDNDVPLTVGKLYVVIGASWERLEMVGDDGGRWEFYDSHFKIVLEP